MWSKIRKNENGKRKFYRVSPIGLYRDIPWHFISFNFSHTSPPVHAGQQRHICQSYQNIFLSLLLFSSFLFSLKFPFSNPNRIFTNFLFSFFFFLALLFVAVLYSVVSLENIFKRLVWISTFCQIQEHDYNVDWHSTYLKTFDSMLMYLLSCSLSHNWIAENYYLIKMPNKLMIDNRIEETEKT